jgi:hypothetical protein
MNDEILSAFLDDELPPGRVAELLERLAPQAPGCADARDRLTTMQLVKDALAGLEVPDDGFTLRILARLDAGRRRDA